jgi:hypothetical protein
VLWICIGFNADLDPAFFVNVDPDSDPGFFYQKLQFAYPQASIKDVQATGEVFVSQK